MAFLPQDRRLMQQARMFTTTALLLASIACGDSGGPSLHGPTTPVGARPSVVAGLVLPDVVG